MGKQLNVDLSVTANTSQAKAQLQSLQTQLNQLSVSSANLKIGVNPADLQKASLAATELAAHLKQATNVDTGALNFAKLNASITSSGQTLRGYGEQLLKLGPQGKQAFSQLAQAVAQSEIPMRKMSGVLGQFGTVLKNTIRWQISSSVIHGFMGSIQQAFNYAQNLNESLNRIQIVTGQNTEQMTKFAESANKAAKSLGTTTTSYTDASLIYYQQGIRDQKEIEARTNTTIKLANVTGQSAEKVSDQMTAIWNNFAKGGGNLEYYADVITALGAATASSSEEIATGLSKFAAVADTVGLSYENATAALATITATTRQSADTVGTGLRTLFSRLQSLKLGQTLEDGVDLTKYSKALNTIGVDVLDVTGNLRSMDDILEDMGHKWQTLTDAQKTAVAQTVGGVRQYTTLMALMENFDFYQENLGVAKSSEGTLQKQQEIYLNSWAAAQKQVRASMESIYSDFINDQFFIKLNKGFAGFLDIIHQITQGLGGLKGVLTGIAGISLRLFSDQATKGLVSFGQNMKMLFTSPEKLQNQRDMDLQWMAERLVGVETGKTLTPEQRYQLAYTKTQIDLQRTYAQNAPLMSPIQQQVAQTTLDNLAQVQRAYETQQQKLSQSQENLSAARSSVIAGTQAGAYRDAIQARMSGRGMTPEQLNLYKEAVRRGYTNWDDATLTRTFNATKYFGDFRTALENNISKPLKEFEAQKDVLKDWSDTSAGSVERLKQKLIDTGMDPDKAREYTDMVSATGKADLKLIEEQLTADFNGNQTNLEAMSRAWGVNLDTLKQYQAALKETNRDEQKIADLRKQLTQQQKNAREATGKKDQSIQVAQGLVSLGQGLMNLSAAASAADKIPDIIAAIGDKSLSTKDGVIQLGASFGQMAMMGVMGFNALKTALTAFSLGSIANPVAAIISLLAVAVPLAISAYDKWLKPETEEEKLERLQEESDKAKQAAQEAKTAYERLADAGDRYNKLQTQLSQLTEGTQAFRDALLEANAVAMEIIKGGNLVYGTDWRYNGYGGIEFLGNAQEEAEEQSRIKAERIQQVSDASAIFPKALEGYGILKQSLEPVQELLDGFFEYLQDSAQYIDEKGIYFAEASELSGDIDFSRLGLNFSNDDEVQEWYNNFQDYILGSFKQKYASNPEEFTFESLDEFSNLQQILSKFSNFYKVFGAWIVDHEGADLDTFFESIGSEEYNSWLSKQNKSVKKASDYWNQQIFNSADSVEDFFSIITGGTSNFSSFFFDQYKANQAEVTTLVSQIIPQLLQPKITNSSGINGIINDRVLGQLMENYDTTPEVEEAINQYFKGEDLDAKLKGLNIDLIDKQENISLLQEYYKILNDGIETDQTDPDALRALVKASAFRNILYKQWDAKQQEYLDIVGTSFSNYRKKTGSELLGMQMPDNVINGGPEAQAIWNSFQEQALREWSQALTGYIETFNLTGAYINRENAENITNGLNTEQLLGITKATSGFVSAFGEDAGAYIIDQLTQEGIQANALNRTSPLLTVLSGLAYTGNTITDLSMVLKATQRLNLTDILGDFSVDEMQKSIMTSIGGQRGLFETLYESEEFEGSLKTLQKTLKKTGKIGADSIIDLADESEVLSDYLEISGINAQTLADTLMALELGDIGIEELSNGLLMAFNAANEVKNTLSDVFAHIDNFQMDRSVMDIGKFYKGLADQIEESQKAGMLLDPALVSSWRELFGDPSFNEYLDWATKATAQQASGHLTPEQMNKQFNEQFAAEIAAMQSIQKNGNLSGLFEYGFKKYGTNGVMMDQATQQALMHYDKTTGQVVMDNDELFKQRFAKQSDFIKYLQDELHVSEDMAKSMAAEFASTDVWAHQTWGKAAADEGVKALEAALESGETLTLKSLQAYEKMYGEFLGEGWLDAFIKAHENAKGAIVDLGDSFDYAHASYDALKKAMSKESGSKGISLEDYLADAQSEDGKWNLQALQQKYAALGFNEDQITRLINDQINTEGILGEQLEATVRRINAEGKIVTETIRGDDADFTAWADKHGYDIETQRGEALIAYSQAQEQLLALTDQANLFATSLAEAITTALTDIEITFKVDEDGIVASVSRAAKNGMDNAAEDGADAASQHYQGSGPKAVEVTDSGTGTSIPAQQAQQAQKAQQAQQAFQAIGDIASNAWDSFTDTASTVGDTVNTIIEAIIAERERQKNTLDLLDTIVEHFNFSPDATPENGFNINEIVASIQDRIRHGEPFTSSQLFDEINNAYTTWFSSYIDSLLDDALSKIKQQEEFSINNLNTATTNAVNEVAAGTSSANAAAAVISASLIENQRTIDEMATEVDAMRQYKADIKAAGGEWTEEMDAKLRTAEDLLTQTQSARDAVLNALTNGGKRAIEGLESQANVNASDSYTPTLQEQGVLSKILPDWITYALANDKTITDLQALGTFLSEMSAAGDEFYQSHSSLDNLYALMESFATDLAEGNPEQYGNFLNEEGFDFAAFMNYALGALITEYKPPENPEVEVETNTGVSAETGSETGNAEPEQTPSPAPPQPTPSQPAPPQPTPERDHIPTTNETPQEEQPSGAEVTSPKPTMPGMILTMEDLQQAMLVGQRSGQEVAAAMGAKYNLPAPSPLPSVEVLTKQLSSYFNMEEDAFIQAMNNQEISQEEIVAALRQINQDLAEEERARKNEELGAAIIESLGLDEWFEQAIRDFIEQCDDIELTTEGNLIVTENEQVTNPTFTNESGKSATLSNASLTQMDIDSQTGDQTYTIQLDPELDDAAKEEMLAELKSVVGEENVSIDPELDPNQVVVQIKKADGTSVTASVDGDLAPLNAEIDAWQALKIVTVKVQGNITNTPAASGYNNNSGNFASGKHVNGYYEGVATAGELGPELWIHNGQPSLVGIHGRTQIYVHPNDKIFTASQTREILRNNPGLQDIPGFNVGYTGLTWGSTGSGGNANNKKTKEFEPERYHVIERQLKELQRLYDLLSKAKENAYGTNKLKAIEAEINATQQLIEGQQVLINEAQKYLDLDKQRMIDLGINLQFDELGNIANWEELQETIGKAAAEGTDENAVNQWKAIKQYEETLDKLHDAQTELQNLIYQLAEAQLEKITTKAEMKISFDERELKLLEYYYKNIEDDIYSMATAFSILGGQIDANIDQLSTLETEYLDVINNLVDKKGNTLVNPNTGKPFQSINEFLNLGYEGINALDINGNWGKILEEINEKRLELLENLRELKTKGLEDIVFKNFDKLNEAVEKQINLFDHYSNMLSTIKDITGLMNTGINKDTRNLLAQLNNAAIENSKNNLASQMSYIKELTKQRDEYQKQLDKETDTDRAKKIQEKLDEIEEKMRDAQENGLSIWKDTLQQAKDIFDSTMESLVEDFKAMMGQSFGSTNLLSTFFDKQKEVDDLYLDQVNKYLGLNKLARTADKYINDLTNINKNITGTSRLKNLQKEINDLLKSGTQISEYDLGVLERRLEAEKALADLQNAQNAKSTVRLQRDQNGNWGYVYTNNEDTVSDLEQAYEDKIGELYTWIMDHQAEIQDKLFDAWSQMADSEKGMADEILNQITGGQISGAEGISRLRSVLLQAGTYDEQTINALTKQLEKTFDDLGYVAEHFSLAGVFTPMEMRDTFGETALGKIGMTLDNFTTDFMVLFNDLGNQFIEAMKTYTNTVDEISSILGLDTTNFGSNISNLIDAIVHTSDENTGQVTERLTELSTLMEQAWTQEQAYWQSEKNKIYEAIRATEAEMNKTESLLKQLNGGVSSLALLETARLGVESYRTGANQVELTNSDIVAYLQQNMGSINALMDQVIASSSSPDFSITDMMIKSGQTMEQNVTIHAEFPNVVNHLEIEEAFNNLANKAAQYANKKNKGIDY